MNQYQTTCNPQRIQGIAHHRQREENGRNRRPSSARPVSTVFRILRFPCKVCRSRLFRQVGDIA
jgi:hypothetical protein